MFKNHNEQGSALLLTIIITMILLVLGGALVSFSLMERGQVGREEADLRAYYIARSGADLMAQALIEDPEKYDTIKGQPSNEVHFDEGYFTAKVEDHPSGVRVSSTGVVGNRKRTVSIILEKDSAAPGFEQAVYANSAISLDGSADIEGDIVIANDSLPAVKLAGNTHIVPRIEDGVVVQEGNVYVPRSVPEDDFDDVVWRANMSCTISGEVMHKVFPVYGPINIEDPPIAFGSTGGIVEEILNNDIVEEIDITASHYKTLKINGPQKSISIDLKNEERSLVIDRLELHSGPGIILKNIGEKGHLHLFIKELIIEGGPARFNYETNDTNPRNDALTVYYHGTKPFGGKNKDDGDYIRFAGNLVTDTAPVFISSSATFKGNIFTNSTELAFGGAGEQDAGLIYAPNAEVTIGNSGKTRSIVSDSFITNGDGKIKYGSVDTTEFPKDIFLPVDGFWDFTRSHWER